MFLFGYIFITIVLAHHITLQSSSIYGLVRVKYRLFMIRIDFKYFTVSHYSVSRFNFPNYIKTHEEATLRFPFQVV